jgi:hypothetical protein
MQLTVEQIRTRGLEALRKSLGRAGMVRFLQQFEKGNGDYTKDRRKWVDQMSLADILEQAKRPPVRKRTTKRMAR